MENENWDIIVHNSQIADTGDYDGYYELTNGKISLFTRDEPDNDDELLSIKDILNYTNFKWYIDDSDSYILEAEKEENRKLYEFLESKKLMDEYKNFVIGNTKINENFNW